MKKSFSILFLCFSILTFSQDIKFKKGIVYIDDQECLKYEAEGNNVSFQNLDGDDIISIQYLRPDGTQESLYTKVIFLEYQQELTSKNYIYTKKALVERLLKSKALENCTLNEEKLQSFILKYDEKVEERLNRNATNTIIIKEEPRKSGININIGGN
jgi:hypothetical protein